MKLRVNKRERLIDIIACIADFALDDFTESHEIQFEDVAQAAYILACFVAQNTPKGEEGVDTEYAMSRMEMRTRMSYDDRLGIARSFVNEFWPKGGPKGEPKGEPKGDPQTPRGEISCGELLVKLQEAYGLAKAINDKPAAKAVSSQPTVEQHRDMPYSAWRKLIHQRIGGPIIYAPQLLENGQTRHYAIQKNRVIGKYETETSLATLWLYPEEKT